MLSFYILVVPETDGRVLVVGRRQKQALEVGAGLITGWASYKRKSTFRKTREGPLSPIHHVKKLSVSAVVTSIKKNEQFEQWVPRSGFWLLEYTMSREKKTSKRHWRICWMCGCLKTGQEGSTTSKMRPPYLYYLVQRGGAWRPLSSLRRLVLFLPEWSCRFLRICECALQRGCRGFA